MKLPFFPFFDIISWYAHLYCPVIIQGKKKFIDKKTAKTFVVVNRSRSDNLYYEEGSTPNVLIPKGMEGAVVNAIA